MTVTGDDCVPRPTPPEVITSMAALLARVSTRLDNGRADAGLIVVDERAAGLLGLTEPATDDGRRQRALDAAAAAGYQAGQIGPWTQFYARSRPTVHVAQLALIRAVTAERGDSALFPMDTPWSPDMAAALAHWHRLSGVPWHAFAPVMGVELMHRTLKPFRVPDPRTGRFSQRAADKRCEATPAEAGVVMWSSDQWYRPQVAAFVHGYDRRRAGITAAGVTKLSPSALVRGWREFDGKRAGWWLIPRPPWNMPELPHPCGPFDGKPYTPQWVTTADMDLLAELDAAGLVEMPQIIDSLTGPARTVLADWQQCVERIIAAPAQGDRIDSYTSQTQELVSGAAKQAGTRGIGMLGKHDGKSSIWRPDWFHSINATKRANAWRAAWKIGRGEGRWPVAFTDDCIWYASDDADAYAAAPKTRNHLGKPIINLADDIPGAFRVQQTKAVETT
jgi:hypothetical protein